MIYSHDYDIIAISETWLSDNIFDNEILPTNYTIHRCDRGSRGGGVLVAVWDNIISRAYPSPTNIEMLTIEVEAVIICVIYLPPTPSLSVVQSLSCHLSKFQESHNLILLGDFNLPDINWDILYGNSAAAELFCDMCFEFNLSQLVSCPTHTHGNILDLLLTNNEDLISTICVSPIDNPLISSDHYTITFELLHVSKLFSLGGGLGVSSKATPHYTFIYSKGDYTGLRNHLLQTDFSTCLSTHDIEKIWNSIELEVVNAMKLFIPIKKHHSIQHPPLFTSEIRHCIKRLRTLRRKYKLHPSQRTLANITALETTTQDMIDTAKLDYESSLVHNFASTNSSKIYDYIKSITKSNHMPSSVNFNSSTASTDHDKANLFNLYFSLSLP